MLQRQPDFMDRPSHLNALAFKCGDDSCPSKQCTLLLDEVNVLQLRTLFKTEMPEAGFESAHTKAAVTNTLVKHCTSGISTPTHFNKVEVAILNRCGAYVTAQLCTKSWAIVVAGMGLSTFNKLRAEIPREIVSRKANLATTGSMLQPLMLLGS